MLKQTHAARFDVLRAFVPVVDTTTYPKVGGHSLPPHVGGLIRVPRHLHGVYLEHTQDRHNVISVRRHTAKGLSANGTAFPLSAWFLFVC